MRLRHGVGAVGLIAFITVLSILPVSAQSPIRIDVTAGFDGRFAYGAPMPVTVTLTSSRATSGTLSVVVPKTGFFPYGPSSPPSSVQSIEVEVPAGGRKTFDLLVVGGPEAAVRFEGDGIDEEVSEHLVPLDGIMVGVLSDVLPAALQSFTRDAAGTSVQVVGLRQEIVALGSEALAAIHYIVIDSAEARTLSPAIQDTLRNWVVGGGRLIVGEGAGGEPEWIPEEWRNDQSVSLLGPGVTAHRAGLGEATLLDGSVSGISREVWGSVLRPFGRYFVIEDEADTSWIDYNLAGAVTGGAGGGLRLGWLAVFLVIYVILIGPANYLVLRRLDRKELLWITVPALALIFGLAGFALSVGNRSETATKQATAIVSAPGGSMGERLAVVSRASTGAVRVGFGGNWATSLPSATGGTSPSRSEVTSEGSVAVLETNPFALSIARGSHRGEHTGYLVADIEWDGRGFFGTVTNRTHYDLTHVSVSMGGQLTHVGSLKRGESGQTAVVPPKQNLPPGSGGPSTGFNPNQTTPDLAESLNGFLARMLGTYHQFGPPMALGITGTSQPEMNIDGETVRPEGALMIASPVRVSIKPGSTGRLPAVASHVQPVSVDGSSQFAGIPPQFRSGNATTLSLQSFTEAILVNHLPRGVDPGEIEEARLELALNVSSSPTGPQPSTQPQPAYQIEVFDWARGEWVAVSVGTSGSQSEIIPVGAVGTRGETLIRMRGGTATFLELWSLGVEVRLK
jgi:hypothetical protein